MGTDKGYTGQFQDAVTGLDYYNARYYDPVMGQFLSADQVQGNGQGMSPYAYVAGNPETATDPTGNSGQENIFQWAEQEGQQILQGGEQLGEDAAQTAVENPEDLIDPEAFLPTLAAQIGLGFLLPQTGGQLTPATIHPVPQFGVTVVQGGQSVAISLAPQQGSSGAASNGNSGGIKWSNLPFSRKHFGRTPSARSNRAIKQRDPTCLYCGDPTETADHFESLKERWDRGDFDGMTPDQLRAAGDDPDCMVGSCNSCNKSKQERPVGNGPGAWNPITSPKNRARGITIWDPIWPCD